MVRWRNKMLAKFETYFDGEDWCARGIDADVFTQGATLDELIDNIREAAELHFEDVLMHGERVHLLVLFEFVLPLPTMEVPRATQVAAS
jgi:predicted RNase H-like HicB family nuclease